MSTRYLTWVSDDMLPFLRAGKLPADLRLIREIGRAEACASTLIEFEDDGAPTEMAGCTVEPTISGQYDGNGNLVRMWISDRYIATERDQKAKP